MSKNVEIERLHKEILFPLVRVKTDEAGGSATVIYSEPIAGSKDEYETYALTNFHVIEDAIAIKKEWSPLKGRHIKKEVRKTVHVEFFEYKYLSECIGGLSVEADIVAWNKDEDLALLRLRSIKKAPYVAKLYPRSKDRAIKLFTPTIVCGCSLGHTPIPTYGRLTGKADEIENTTYWMSTAASLFGNCHPADTLISMADGSVREISKVKSGDRIWSVGENVGLSKNTVQEVIKAGEKSIFSLKTRTRTVRASGNHPLLTVTSVLDWSGNRRNTLIWKKLEDIKKDDIIAVLPSLPDNKRNVGIRFADFIPQTENRRDLMKLLGFYLGDGWITEREGISYSFNLATYNKERTEEYSRILNELFGINKFGSSKDKIECYSKKMVNIIKRLGLSGGSTKRTVPNWVMSCSHTLQRAFLEGYIEADGYITKLGDWAFEANNKGLIKRIRLMCIHLGINVSNITSRMRDATVINGRVSKPTEMSYAFQAYPNYSKNNSCHIEGDTSLLPSFLTYEHVRGINPDGKEQTYDLKVNRRHNFFADGILVHNSGGAVFLENGQFIGVPARITTIQLGFGIDVITHMGFFIHIERVYDFLENQIFQFIYDKKCTSAMCEEMREDRRKEEDRKLIIETVESEDDRVKIAEPEEEESDE